MSSTDVTYDLLSIPTVDVDIIDDDIVGTIADPTGPVAVTEGGATQSLTLALTSQPTSPVTIAVDGGAQVNASPATITFQPTSWNVPQQVVGRRDRRPDRRARSASRTGHVQRDGRRRGYLTHTPAPVDVSITDNDTPGVIVAATDSGNAVGEAGTTDTLNVRLGTLPSDDVTVTLELGAQVTATPATLTFTPANWNAVQPITIGAVQDQIVEGEHTGTLAFVLASNDAAYGAGTAATPASQPVTITDDDAAGVTIVETDAKTNVAEAGGTDTYTIALSGQPTADVTIAATGGTQVAAAPASITFTAANWNTPQTVTVSAVQDSIDEADPHGGEVTHVATTTAAGWTGANVAGVVASIADDDAASIVATQSDGTTRVTEGNSKGDTITFTLASQPTAEVSIVAKGDTQVSVSDKPIVFTPAKWKDGIELKVTAIDDEEVEGDHEGTLTFAVSSDDPTYKKATSPAITVEVNDNDVDKALPNDTGEEDEDGGAGTRNPRASVPPATIKQPDSDEDAEAGRRTSDGATRTDEGSARTPDGVEGTSTAGTTNPDGVRTGRRLGGEVVAAKEEETTSKRRTPMAKVLRRLVQGQLAADGAHRRRWHRHRGHRRVAHARRPDQGGTARSRSEGCGRGRASRGRQGHPARAPASRRQRRVTTTRTTRRRVRSSRVRERAASCRGDCTIRTVLEDDWCSRGGIDARLRRRVHDAYRSGRRLVQSRSRSQAGDRGARRFVTMSCRIRDDLGTKRAYVVTCGERRFVHVPRPSPLAPRPHVLDRAPGRRVWRRWILGSRRGLTRSAAIQ